MKTTVVCGLLGSGKTTFIRSHFRMRSEKTVVLVNDFSSAGIDGEIFSAGGIQAVELPSGCVCCTLKADLITAVTRIITRFLPEQLVIEPSGVASPSGVIEALESAGVDGCSIVCIVDAAEFADLYQAGMYGSFFRDQIALADVVLVNKIDLADAATVMETERIIESINPGAIAVRTILGEMQHPLPPEKTAPRRGVSAPNLLFNSSRHLQFETVSFRLDSRANRARFSRFFSELAAGRYGNVVRSKALLDTDRGACRSDLVFRKVDIRPFGGAIGASRIVVIGNKLDAEGIRSALRRVQG